MNRTLRVATAVLAIITIGSGIAAVSSPGRCIIDIECTSCRSERMEPPCWGCAASVIIRGEACSYAACGASGTTCLYICPFDL